MKAQKTATVLLGLSILFLFIGVGLFIALKWRGLYISGIEEWDLVSSSGFDRETIVRNYNAMMDWTCPFVTGHLALPDIQLSDSFSKHFDECKPLFNFFLAAGAVSLPAAAGLTAMFIRKRKHKCIRNAGLIALLIPALLGVIALIDGDALFVLYHNILFKEGTWRFNRQLDPLIRILPEAYFIKCAAVVILTVVFGCLAAVLTGILADRRAKKRAV